MFAVGNDLDEAAFDTDEDDLHSDDSSDDDEDDEEGEASLEGEIAFSPPSAAAQMEQEPSEDEAAANGPKTCALCPNKVFVTDADAERHLQSAVRWLARLPACIPERHNVPLS